MNHRKSTDSVEGYVKSLYEDIGGDASDIAQVIGVKVGSGSPIGYRVTRTDGATAIVWSKHIDERDAAKIRGALTGFKPVGSSAG